MLLHPREEGDFAASGRKMLQQVLYLLWAMASKLITPRARLKSALIPIKTCAPILAMLDRFFSRGDAELATRILRHFFEVRQRIYTRIVELRTT